MAAIEEREAHNEYLFGGRGYPRKHAMHDFSSFEQSPKLGSYSDSARQDRLRQQCLEDEFGVNREPVQYFQFSLYEALSRGSGREFSEPSKHR